MRRGADASGGSLFAALRFVAAAALIAILHGAPAIAQLALYFDPDPELPKPLFVQTDLGSQIGYFQLLSAVADFTGDGYGDVVLAGWSDEGGPSFPARSF